MIDLAQHNTGDYIPLEEIVARQDISKKYMERILPALVAGGLIEGARGKGGGYRLLCQPATCTVADVLRLTEGNLAPVSCLDKSPNPCPRASTCKTLPMWEKYWKMTIDFFEGISIADLVRNPGVVDFSI
jgi:Rrf2 family protein